MRVVFYLLIPIASWFGGLLIEGMLGLEGIVGPNARNEWDLRLNEDVTMDLSIDLSSGNAFVDLSGNWGNDAQIELAASSGQITLSLPRDVGVYVDAYTSSGNIDASGFRSEGSNYVNDAYGESNETINVKATVISENIELQLVD